MQFKSLTIDIASILLAITVILGTGWRLLRFIRKFVHAVDVVLHELLPNSGSSMRDAIMRIDKQVLGLHDRLVVIEENGKETPEKK